jgi:trimethylamine--corrinoid protein Co-methyltransferase
MRPGLQVLSPATIASVLDEAKRVLHEVGMEIRGPAMKQLLLDRGFEARGDRISFPPEAVDRALKTAPPSFILYDRDGNPHADLGGDRVHFVPGSSGLNIADHRTGEARAATSRDFVEYVRVADGLEHVVNLATAFSTNDIEAAVSDAWRLFMCLTQSKRPIVSGAFTEHGVKRMAEMMQLFRRDRADLIARPMAIFTVTATGSFRYGEDSCQNLIDCVEAGIPVEIVPVTLMGLIAPVTLLGATVFHTIDVLAGITMAQTVRPGAPVLFGGAPAAFHMRAASSPMAAVEALHLDVAYVAVAKALGLPTQAYMGLSDGKFLDAQAGAETFGSALLAALAGVNSVSGPGMLDFVLTFSLPKLILDNELCGQALHFCRAITPTDDLPVGGLVEELLNENHLVTSPHTTANWQTEMYLTGSVIDRDNRENWARKGAVDLEGRAAAEVERRLDSYEPVEIDPAVATELEAIIRAGLVEQSELPEIPPAPTPTKAEPGRRNRRRAKP